MGTFAADDLISLASASSTTMSASPVKAPPQPKLRSAENARPAQVRGDSFASLAGLMKSKKPWAQAPKPLAQVPNGHFKMPVGLTPQSIGNPLPKQPKTLTSTISPFQTHRRSRLSTEGAALAENSTKQKVPLTNPPAHEGGYDKDAMNKMDEMIAAMGSLGLAEPSEPKVVEPISQKLLDLSPQTLPVADSAQSFLQSRNVEAHSSGFQSKSRAVQPTSQQLLDLSPQTLLGAYSAQSFWQSRNVEAHPSCLQSESKIAQPTCPQPRQLVDLSPQTLFRADATESFKQGYIAEMQSSSFQPKPIIAQPASRHIHQSADPSPPETVIETGTADSFMQQDHVGEAHSSGWQPADNEPIVRCTQKVWDTMIKQMETLKKAKLEAQSKLQAYSKLVPVQRDKQIRALEEQVSVLKREKAEIMTKLAVKERDEHQRTQVKGDNSSELDQLRYRLEMNKDYKAVMNRDIRQKDAELVQKNLEIDDLKKQVADTVEMEKQLEKLRAENTYLCAEAEQAAETAQATHTDQLVESLRRDIELKDRDSASKDQEIVSKNREIARLKDEVAHIEMKISDHQTRAGNLFDTQNAREKKLKQTEQRVRVLEDGREKLLDEIDMLKTEVNPMKHQIKDLEGQLKEKTSACDRMRSKLHDTEQRHEFALKSLHKVDNHLQLKGAAHALVPGAKTKLPKLVLPCMECFAKNLTCDSKSRCQSCVDHGEKCLRWKCSQMHILREGCQDYPCYLTHDANGWLMLKGEQPQW